ncbi:MAG: AAA family ATPase [Pseudomonadota bacterium]
MYLSFYGLTEKPFAITPDPRYLYLSGRHAEALAHLVYGIDEAGGFVQLTGEVGTGKTTIIRSLLARAPKNAEIALILNPRMNAEEFMLTICEELGIGVPDYAEGSTKDLIDILNRYLLRTHAEGRRVVLVVDEAQNLSPDLLEQVRLLTNLETETQKLLQIILIGQPELRELLARNDLRQLAQRITGRYHLDPLSPSEAQAYIKHRLRIAGATMDIFSPPALRELYRVSGGVPRLLNIIGDRALLGGYTEDRHRIAAATVRRAAREVFDRRVLPVWLPWTVGAACVLLLAAGSTLAWRTLRERDAAAQAAATAAAAAEAAAAARAAAVPAAPPAPVAPPLAAPRSVAELLRDYAGQTDIDSAYTRLFARWDARYVAGTEDACTQAIRQGLECLVQRGTLTQLQVFNRPAVLELDDAAGAHHQVVLVRLSDSTADLMLGEGDQPVTTTDLLAHWQGGYVLLWKPPDLDTRPLAVGMRGGTVRLLRERLQRWQGRAPDTTADPYFDQELQTLVSQFQSQHGLLVDGIAGVQTQVALDAALAETGMPVLKPAAGS